MSQLETLHITLPDVSHAEMELTIKKTKTQYKGSYLNKKLLNEHLCENKYLILCYF